MRLHLWANFPFVGDNLTCRLGRTVGRARLSVDVLRTSVLTLVWEGVVAWNPPMATLEPQLTHWPCLSPSEQQGPQTIARNNDSVPYRTKAQIFQLYIAK